MSAAKHAIRPGVALNYPAVEAYARHTSAVGLVPGVRSSVKSATFGGDSVFRSGAPRPMKATTMSTPQPYEITALITQEQLAARCSARGRYDRPAAIER